MLEKLSTESRNHNTVGLDEMTMKDILLTMNKEDLNVPQAIKKEIDQIEQVVQAVIRSFQAGAIVLYRCRNERPAWHFRCG